MWTAGFQAKCPCYVSYFSITVTRHLKENLRRGRIYFGYWFHGAQSVMVEKPWHGRAVYIKINRKQPGLEEDSGTSSAPPNKETSPGWRLVLAVNSTREKGLCAHLWEIILITSLEVGRLTTVGGTTPWLGSITVWVERPKHQWVLTVLCLLIVCVCVGGWAATASSSCHLDFPTMEDCTLEQCASVL